MNTFRGPRSISNGDFPSINFTLESNNSRTSYTLPQTSGTPRSTPNSPYTASIAVRTEYSVRTAMEAVYGLLGVDRGVPEVWGSVYDVRELLDSSVKLMDGKSPLEIDLGPLNVFKKPILKAIKGTVIEKLLKDHDIIKSDMKY